jgi:hypothetical protein
MNNARGQIRLLMTGILLAVAMTGCSDKSRMVLNIRSILTKGSGALLSGLPYLEADMMGDTNLSHCSTIQDQVEVTVNLESPGLLTDPTTANRNLTTGTFGPTVSGFITGFRLEYFYFDPNDGALRGPVSGLTVNTTNIHQKVYANAGDVGIVIPVTTFNVKAWCARATCGGNPGFAGPGYVSRMIIRITMLGEDQTGKKLSAQGDIAVYLYDYGPYPQPVAGGGQPAADDTCLPFSQAQNLFGDWSQPNACN